MRDALQNADLVALLLLLAHLTLSLIAIVMVSANRRPSAAIAWVLAILFIPFVGAVAFLFVGIGRLPRERREKQRFVDARALERTPGLSLVSHADEWPPWLRSAAELNRRLGSLPMVGGNAALLLEDYTGSFESMIRDIDTATDYVHVEFYILVLDPSTAPFMDALGRAVERGVAVRVLSDHLAGLLDSNRAGTRERLRELGAEWHAMLPLRPLKGQWQRPDMRNHRKIVVVDGRVAYTGSQNLSDAS